MNSASANIKYDESYFDKVMSDANKEEAFKHGKTFEKILSKVNNNKLANLFMLEGKEFYKELLTIFGTLRFFHPRDKSIQQGIDELKQATGLEGEEFDEYLKSEGIDPKTFGVNGESTTKLAIGKVLGFLKVVWDTSVIGLGFFSRVSVCLVGSVGKALFDTAMFAKRDAKASFFSIKESWKRNMH